MSVINQTLRDLQKRGVKPTIAFQSQPTLPEAPVRGTLSGLGLKLVAAGLFLAAGFSAALLFKGIDEPSAFMFTPQSASNDVEQGAAQTRSAEPNLQSVEKHQGMPASSPIANASTEATGERTYIAAEPSTKLREQEQEQEQEQVRAADAPRGKQETVLVPPIAQTISDPPKPVFKADPVQIEASVTISPETLDQQSATSARKLLAKGHSDAARQQLESFVDTNSVHQASLLELAKLLTKTKDSVALDALLLKQQDSENSDFLAVAARRYVELGELSKAQRILERRLPAIEAYVHYYSLLAAVYQKQGQYLKQVDIYQRLIEVHGDRAKWWLGVAVAWDHLKQYEPARHAYTKAQQLKLNDAQLMVFAGQRLKQLKGY